MNPLAAPDWRHSDSPVDYETAITEMSERVDAIRRDGADEQVWLLEHPPLYTAGTSAGDGDLLEPDLFPVHRTGRGGEFTYHGPGQRVAYVMLDLERRGRDVRCYVHHLEEWIILALVALNVEARRIPGRVGVWVPRPDKGKDRHDKIAAIGVRVRRWVTWHGVSINVSPDLYHYRGIVPCGIRDDGVTSLEDLGQIVSMAEFDSVLRTAFAQVFGAPLGCHDG